MWNSYNSQMTPLWFFILWICSIVPLFLSTVLIIIRIYAKYSFREIEDIMVFDKSQKTA